jgi:hypothetical protein
VPTSPSAGRRDEEAEPDRAGLAGEATDRPGAVGFAGEAAGPAGGVGLPSPGLGSLRIAFPVDGHTISRPSCGKPQWRHRMNR